VGLRGQVSINRGNHENLEMNRRPADYGGGFYDEVMSKYDAALFMMFQQVPHTHARTHARTHACMHACTHARTCTRTHTFIRRSS
jgi:hypothetical protein